MLNFKDFVELVPGPRAMDTLFVFNNIMMGSHKKTQKYMLRL